MSTGLLTRPLSVGRLDADAKHRGFDEIRKRHPQAMAPEDDRELLRLHDLGWGKAMLAERCGRQPSAIKSRLKKLRE